jgi:DNA-binding transcriptional LysR family regulator
MIAAAQPDSYAARTLLENRVKNAALILHDVGSKDERKEWVEDFKAGKIDLLFVYNMLLTGFDAKRLKKLYLGRVIKAHNLLAGTHPRQSHLQGFPLRLRGRLCRHPQGIRQDQQRLL